MASDQDRKPHDMPEHGHVTGIQVFQAAVEEVKEPACQQVDESRQPVPFGRLRLEKQRGQRGAERQRIECREERREGDGQGELPVELPGDAADEGHGNEDGGQPDRRSR